jgi:hypothetical protein
MHISSLSSFGEEIIDTGGRNGSSFSEAATAVPTQALPLTADLLARISDTYGF